MELLQRIRKYEDELEPEDNAEDDAEDDNDDDGVKYGSIFAKK